MLSRVVISSILDFYVLSSNFEMQINICDDPPSLIHCSDSFIIY